MTTIMITGISGTGVRSLVDEAVQFANTKFEADFYLIDLGRVMYEEDIGKGNLDYERWEATILKRLAVLPYLRRVAFDRITDDVAKEQHATYLILSKATFWHNKTILSGFDQTRLNYLRPDCFVTIVNDVIDVWRKLCKTKQQRWNDLSPIDVLEWREIETFFTEQMARILGDKDAPKPFYVFAVRYGPQLLAKMLLNPELKRIYRSYPISFVHDRPEVKREADKLAEHLEKTAIVFDPKGIQDYDRLTELRNAYTSWCSSRSFPSLGADWEQIRKHVSHQTVSRDHRLIDQSDYIAVYYPELIYYTKKGTKYKRTRLVPFSSGVLDEMHYATERGKEVLLLWNSKQDPGPFLSNIHTEKFNSIDKLLEFAKELNDRKKITTTSAGDGMAEAQGGEHGNHSAKHFATDD